MLPDDRSLHIRILVAIALVILLPFAFLYTFELAVNHVLLPMLERGGYGPYYGQFYVSPLLAVILVVGGICAQLWLGPRTILGSIDARRVTEDQHPEVAERVTRIAQQADVDRPGLAIARNRTPNAAAVRGPTGGTIVLTTGLLEHLDGEELDAVLAHEIAHLKNRDATVMTVAWLLPTVTYYLAISAGWVLYGMYRALGAGSTSRGSGGRGVAQVVLVLTVTAIVTIAVSALFWAASVLVHRVLSRYREFAADRAAAALTGNPSALASALGTIDDRMPDVPDRDLRRLDGGTEALYLAPLEGRAFANAELVSTDIFPDTHPPTSDRIDRLRDMAGELA